ncbi:hypothetical protein MY8738_005258 [Beauveria namnaoensis]
MNRRTQVSKTTSHNAAEGLHLECAAQQHIHKQSKPPGNNRLQNWQPQASKAAPTQGHPTRGHLPQRKATRREATQRKAARQQVTPEC